MRAIAAELQVGHMAIDLAQMRTSREGMSYFLVVIDICTRFAWLFALPDKMSTMVASALRSLFMTFVFPRILQSDNDSEFINLNVQQVLDLA
jgi:transposase InsO family protein